MDPSCDRLIEVTLYVLVTCIIDAKTAKAVEQRTALPADGQSASVVPSA